MSRYGTGTGLLEPEIQNAWEAETNRQAQADWIEDPSDFAPPDCDYYEEPDFISYVERHSIAVEEDPCLWDAWDDGNSSHVFSEASDEEDDRDGEEEEEFEGFNSQLWLYAAGVAGLAIGLFHPPVKAMGAVLLDFMPASKPVSHRPQQPHLLRDRPSVASPKARERSLEKGGISTTSDRPLELTFDPAQFGPNAERPLPPSSATPIPLEEAAPRQLKLRKLQIQLPPKLPLKELFAGDTASLVAKAVGAAEGTRTPDGQRTQAYYGHRDPGNGVWNLGTFSYQHGATSPQEADRKQLRRLERQATVLRQQAAAQGLELSLAEELNGIDLANQSPRAALDRGYIKRLKQAREKGLTGSEAVIWARTYAYQDPQTGRWNAPGLGNTPASVRRDQRRRVEAVQEAIVAHEEANSATIALAPSQLRAQPETTTEDQASPVTPPSPALKGMAQMTQVATELPSPSPAIEPESSSSPSATFPGSLAQETPPAETQAPIVNSQSSRSIAVWGSEPGRFDNGREGAETIRTQRRAVIVTGEGKLYDRPTRTHPWERLKALAADRPSEMTPPSGSIPTETQPISPKSSTVPKTSPASDESSPSSIQSSPSVSSDRQDFVEIKRETQEPLSSEPIHSVSQPNSIPEGSSLPTQFSIRNNPISL